MIYRVELSRRAIKDIARVPVHVAEKLQLWIDSMKRVGLEEIRKVPGYHDEPLKGQRAGQRSVRLSRGYRAIYSIARNGAVEIAWVEEVNKHEY